MSVEYPFRPLSDVSEDSSITDSPIRMMTALIRGIDAAAHLRFPPADLLSTMNKSTQHAILKIYEDPYSTWETRNVIDGSKDLSGTRPGAREKIISMAGLLTIAQCKICARGQELEKLVQSRFNAMTAIPSSFSSVRKRTENWQRKRRHLPMFADANATKTAVLCIVRINIGKKMGSDSEMIKRIRQMRSKIMAETLLEERDLLPTDALMSVADFSHHNDEQVKKMIAALRKANFSYRQATSKYWSYFSQIMADNNDVLGDAYLDFFKSCSKSANRNS